MLLLLICRGKKVDIVNECYASSVLDMWNPSAEVVTFILNNILIVKMHLICVYLLYFLLKSIFIFYSWLICIFNKNSHSVEVYFDHFNTMHTIQKRNFIYFVVGTECYGPLQDFIEDITIKAFSPMLSTIIKLN